MWLPLDVEHGFGGPMSHIRRASRKGEPPGEPEDAVMAAQRSSRPREDLAARDSRIVRVLLDGAGVDTLLLARAMFGLGTDAQTVRFALDSLVKTSCKWMNDDQRAAMIAAEHAKDDGRAMFVPDDSQR